MPVDVCVFVGTELSVFQTGLLKTKPVALCTYLFISHCVCFGVCDIHPVIHK